MSNKLEGSIKLEHALIDASKKASIDNHPTPRHSSSILFYNKIAWGGVMMKSAVICGVLFSFVLTPNAFAQQSWTPDGFGGQRFSNGTTATPDGFGGKRYHNGVTATPDGFGGTRFSNGLTATPDGFGGTRYNNGVTATPDGFGGMRYSNGVNCTPDGFGGMRCN